MKEFFEFRIFKDVYHLLPKPNGAKFNGMVYVLKVPKNDPLVKIIGNLDRKLRRKGDCFFSFWNISRKYSKAELAEATLLQVKIKSTFEPAGEECGTEYDESTSCKICGSGRKQIGPLQLRKSSIPRKDIARTIAGEVIVSKAFVSAFKSYGLKGATFNSVYSMGKPIDYYQPEFNSPPLLLTENTVAGITPFDLSDSSNGEIYKCPEGHTIGLNLLSEAYVRKVKEIELFDFFQTYQKIGVKRGLLRPNPLYLCSQAFRKMVVEEKLKGFEFEVAHLE